MWNFISGEKLNIQKCENLIKNRKNTGETREMDKRMPVMKAQQRCDHYAWILVHLPPNIKLSWVWDKRAINAYGLIFSMSQAECNQIVDGTAGILKSFYFSLFMGAKTSLAHIYCTCVACSSPPWHPLILHIEPSFPFIIIQKCFSHKLA